MAISENAAMEQIQFQIHFRSDIDQSEAMLNSDILQLFGEGGCILML